MSENGTRFNCPHCNALYTKIIKTEMLTKFKRRVRECPRCERTFETLEKYAVEPKKKPPKDSDKDGKGKGSDKDKGKGKGKDKDKDKEKKG
jgi:transcriptional regulator NrdR family protein